MRDREENERLREAIKEAIHALTYVLGGDYRALDILKNAIGISITPRDEDDYISPIG